MFLLCRIKKIILWVCRFFLRWFANSGCALRSFQKSICIKFFTRNVQFNFENIGYNLLVEFLEKIQKFHVFSWSKVFLDTLNAVLTNSAQSLTFTSLSSRLLILCYFFHLSFFSIQFSEIPPGLINVFVIRSWLDLHHRRPDENPTTARRSRTAVALLSTSTKSSFFTAESFVFGCNGKIMRSFFQNWVFLSKFAYSGWIDNRHSNIVKNPEKHMKLFHE